MPELPEVETVVRALRQTLEGRVVEKAHFLGRCRYPFDAAAATATLGKKMFRGVRRRAKYIIMDFDCDTAILAHLGMTGYFHVDAASSPPHKHDRIAFSLKGGEELRYADARRFGFVRLVRTAGPGSMPEELAALGPEPLERSFSGKYLGERAAGRKGPVKVFIMDQAVVVGVGNIYAAEALFAAGVDPRRPAGSLNAEEWGRVAAEIKAVLRRALRRGGSTIRNYRTVDGSEGAFQRSLKVYGKAGDGCPSCGGPIAVTRQAGRSSFFCPACQK